MPRKRTKTQLINMISAIRKKSGLLSPFGMGDPLISGKDYNTIHAILRRAENKLK